MNAFVPTDDIRKAVVDSLSNPSEDIARHVLAMAGANPSQIEKAITTGTGLVAYDLQAPAKNLYPINTPLIRSLPRTGGVGTATNWKAVTGINGSGFDATGWVPEGQRAGQMSYSVSARSAAYATIGEEDQATWEAISAGRTFEDVQATMTTRLLQKMMLKEEMAVLGGNASLWCQQQACEPEIMQAFTAALDLLTQRDGADMSTWRWGDEHVTVLRHKFYQHVPLFDWLTELDAPSSGDFYTLDRGGGFEEPEGMPFARTQGGGFRGLYDLSDLDKSRFMITSGQSGHIFSAHYGDLAPLWIDVKSITIAGSEEELKAAGAKELTLSPR